MSLFAGEKTKRNPWDSTTVEWSAPSPPLPMLILMLRSMSIIAYEYSVTRLKKRFYTSI